MAQCVNSNDFIYKLILSYVKLQKMLSMLYRDLKKLNKGKVKYFEKKLLTSIFIRPDQFVSSDIFFSYYYRYTKQFRKRNKFYTHITL